MNHNVHKAAIFALIAGLLVAGCGGSQSRFEDHMRRGEKLLNERNFTKANIEFRNAMLISPKNPAALMMAGRASEGLGNIRDAVGLYQASLDATPAKDNEETSARLARLLILGGQPDRAAALVESALAKHPNSAPLLTYRAAARMQLKNPGGALEDVERALRLDPDNEDAIALRASMYRNAGELGQAIDLVTGALKRHPASTSLRELLASVYMDADEPSKAEEQLRSLIASEPTELSYRNQLALFYVASQKLDDAQRVLEKSVQDFPHNVDAKTALVNFISTRRTRAQGESTLRALIAKTPDDYDLRLGLGSLLQRNGAVKEASEQYNEVIRLAGTTPKGLEARDRLAGLAAVQGRFDDARKLVDEVLQKSPRDTQALATRGEIYLLRNDATAAVADLRAALRDQPHAPALAVALAKAFEANGQPNLAEQTLREAMDSNPLDTSVRIELSKLLVSDGRAQQAVSLLEETVRRSPTDAEAREALVHAYLDSGSLPSARTAVAALIALRPDSASGPFLSGIIAQREQKLDEAQKDFEHALAMQPRAFEVLSALTRLEVERGQTSQATALVNRTIETDPKNAALFDLLGQLQVAAGSPAAAIQSLTKATQLAPGWWVPYRNLALARHAAKDTAGAVTAFEQAIKAAPSEPQPVTELGSLLRSMGRTEDAIAMYERWNRANPRVQPVANNLAMLLVTYRSDQQSLDRARDLVSELAGSSNGEFLDTAGWVHFKRAEYRDALSTLQRAAERDPNSNEIRYHLGMTELRMGEKDRARDDLRKALSGSGNFAGSDEARTALASIEPRSG